MNKDQLLPPLQEFLANSPIYTSYKYEGTERAEELLYGSLTIDLYCSQCKRETTFTELMNRGEGSNLSSPKQQFVLPKYFFRKLCCARNDDHEAYFSFFSFSGYVQKIGQHPSHADLNVTPVSKYKKILSDNDYLELKRSIGLVAHGIGIGSFVYLRRIFETLIDEAHEKSQQQLNWDKDAFHKARMAEKIKLVANHLPSFLVDNASVYSILSKGIHDLTDEECLAHFPIVLNAIELILDEKIADQNRLEKIRLTQKSIKDLHANLKNQQE